MKTSYTTYGCMLLLPAHAFASLAWLEEIQHRDPDDLRRLYQLLAKHLKISHIAINKPIPPQQADGSDHNFIRSPINFTPLFGDFGPSTCQSPPTQEDFDEAFWVTAKQNGIFQTWAPRWTMFSRGNISEKARLMSLPSVQQAVKEGNVNGRGCAAADLYAGIGYFTFSYLMAGCSKVLCWEFNPWSIEGLKRGAAANKWKLATYDSNSCSWDPSEANARLLVFKESNDWAVARKRQNAASTPPVRHVNCGLLPTSRGSWGTAVRMLDAEMGGWIHVHENLAIYEIGERVQQIRNAFQEVVDRLNANVFVEVQDVNRLKSYAPGVMHCVIDLHIPSWLPQ